jgi:hypothetical protein
MSIAFPATVGSLANMALSVSICSEAKPGERRTRPPSLPPSILPAHEDSDTLLRPFFICSCRRSRNGEPVFADLLAATASDHAQATVTAIEQPESLAPVWSSSDLPAPASRAGLGKTITPLVWPG